MRTSLLQARLLILGNETWGRLALFGNKTLIQLHIFIIILLSYFHDDIEQYTVCTVICYNYYKLKTSQVSIHLMHLVSIRLLGVAIVMVNFCCIDIIG